MYVCEREREREEGKHRERERERERVREGEQKKIKKTVRDGKSECKWKEKALENVDFNDNKMNV